MKTVTSAQFLTTLGENITSLRNSAYSETLAFSKVDATIMAKCTFAKEDDRYRVTMHTDFGPVYSYAKTNKPTFVGLVRCPEDTAYDFVDPKSGERKSGVTRAGQCKVVFY
jgi:hypothetical protein